MRTHLWWVALCTLLGTGLFGQETVDSVDTHIKWRGDFRFRVEHDWNSRRPDGSYRADRSRLRYRLRLGFSKAWDARWSMGAQIRSGNIMDQQGPHLTIGGGPNAEFGLAQIGFEKAYLLYEQENSWVWLGKKDYPFYKEHELLWNDNVFPEGLAAGHQLLTKGNYTLKLGGGYFIVRSNGQLLNLDSYLLTLQTLQEWTVHQGWWRYHVGLLHFHQMPNIPDGQQEYFMDYTILTQSLYRQWEMGKHSLRAGLDLYLNLTQYDEALVGSTLQDQREGMVVCLKWGQLKRKGDWTFHAYWTYLERYAIVDFLAQNDWARWDYSGLNASGSRLSNLHGIEGRVGWQATDFLNVVLRFYHVEQIVPLDVFTETGTRIRIDLNAKF